MRAWLESIAGPEYASAMIWTLGALILLLVILLAVRIVRGLTFGTFVAGGRNRKTRLAVMDAAAVDSHRRLVLVRRDDIEHLILIGGPTDVVVEQNIRLQSPARRVIPPDQRGHADEVQIRQAPDSLKPPSAAAEPPPESRPRPGPAEVPRAAAAEAPKPAQTQSFASRVTSSFARPPAQPAPPSPAPAPAAAQPAAVQPASTPAPAAPRPSPAAGAAAPAAAASDKSGDLDDALLQELEVTLGEKSAAKSDADSKKMDDEMSRLLGDLTPRRDK